MCLDHQNEMIFFSSNFSDDRFFSNKNGLTRLKDFEAERKSKPGVARWYVFKTKNPIFG
jgi:hypothetical protein